MNPPRPVVLTFCYLFLLLLLSGTSSAQLEQSSFLSPQSVSQTTSNYYFAKPNELTLIVSVIGYAQRPGRYEISKSIDLINLIALAGGATSDGTLGDVTVTRFMEQGGRILRKEQRVDLDNLTRVAVGDLVIFPGDVIAIGRSSWATVRDVLIVTGTVAVIASAVMNVVYWNRMSNK